MNDWMTGNYEWISVEDELPPRDGIYTCQMHDEFVDCYPLDLLYDGIGFKLKRQYQEIKFWKYATTFKKKYGKVKKDD
jgi:hypothetical protein